MCCYDNCCNTFRTDLTYIFFKLRVQIFCTVDGIKILQLKNAEPNKVKGKIPFQCRYMDFDQVSHYDLVLYCVLL